MSLSKDGKRSWNDYLTVTEPAASSDYSYRATGIPRLQHRLAVESMKFQFNREGGAGADPQNPPPLTYEDRTVGYTWDANYSKASVEDVMEGYFPAPRTSTFDYDHLNRLIESETVNSSATSSMEMDYGDLGRLGNRDTVTLTSDDFTAGNAFDTYVVDPAGVEQNAYTTAATAHPDYARSQTYDDNGNLTGIDDGAGNTRTLGYDPHNRLVEHSSTSGLTTRYRYDALGRRIQRNVVNGPGDPSQDDITRFLYSGHQVIEERNGAGAVLASYVYGRGLDEVVSMRRDVLDDATGAFSPDGNAEDYFYLGDLQSNTLILVDADGQMVEAYAYGSELRPYAHFEGGATAYQYPNDFGMPAILDENGDVLHADFTKTGLPGHLQAPADVTNGSPYQSRYGNPYLFNGP